MTLTHLLGWTHPRRLMSTDSKRHASMVAVRLHHEAPILPHDLSADVFVTQVNKRQLQEGVERPDSEQLCPGPSH